MCENGLIWVTVSILKINPPNSKEFVNKHAQIARRHSMDKNWWLQNQIFNGTSFPDIIIKIGAEICVDIYRACFLNSHFDSEKTQNRFILAMRIILFQPALEIQTCL